MTHATRPNPLVAGAATTVVPYCCTNDCRIRSSLSPRFREASNSPRILSEYWQPTWLHSSRIWLQPQTHIMRWPRSLKRAESPPAPRNPKTPTTSRTTCNPCLIEKDKDRRISHPLRLGQPAHARERLPWPARHLVPVQSPFRR